MRSKISYISLLLWIVSFEIISYSIGFLAKSDKNWYNSLVKSNVTPSPTTLAIIWPILYAILGISGYFIWTSRRENELLFKSFWIMMLVSWSWIPIFFGIKALELAHILMAILVVLTIYVVYEANKSNKVIFYLLVPYLSWVCFAYYLNIMLFISN